MSESKATHTEPQERRKSPIDRPLVPWEEVSEAEDALLQRVEAQVLTAHDQAAHGAHESGQDTAWQGTHGWQWWGWSSAALAGAMIIFVVWGLGGEDVRHLPALQAEGTLKLQTLRQRDHKAQYIETTLQQGARLRDPQGWSLRSQAKSQLLVIRRAGRRSLIRLKRGAIRVHVRPGSMRRFVVACHDQLQVVVQGTRFLVWQSASGVRVEVTRGHVMLRRGERVLLHLYKGQGAYIKKREESLQTYQVSSASKHQDWLKKIEWLAKHQPAHLFAYAEELASGSVLTPKVRLQVLETAAHALQGSRRWSEARRLWERVYKLRPKGLEAQTSLFQAAESCRRSRATKRSCARLYRRWLTRFPQGLLSLRVPALYWANALILQDDETPLTQRQRAITKLRAYVKAHPHAIHTKAAMRLVR